MTPLRTAALVTAGMPASDGAGVKLTRLLGTPQVDHFDPFLLLDKFYSDNPDDYLAGFPEHPHRGFETVTYLLHGKMRHRDSTGREGVIEAGGVQWMSAARGIVHSEMPEQENGLLAGFQLWVNLPARDKMNPPRYQEFAASAMAEERREGLLLRIISGETHLGNRGPVQQIATAPLYLDISAEQPGARFEEPLPDSHNAMVYVIDGSVTLAPDSSSSKVLRAGELALLEPPGAVQLQADSEHARCLFMAAQRLNEPVVRYGPFVMDSREALMQAFKDFRTGQFL